jgi:hypothetical protein
MRRTVRSAFRVLTLGCAVALPLLGLVGCSGGGDPAGATTVPATVAASNWTAMPTSLPTPATDRFPYSVSCVTSVFCLAVGANGLFNGSGSYFAEQWNGTTWTSVTLPSPSGASDLILGQVSCTSTTFCVAVGQETISSTETPLILQWNGSSFSVAQGATGASSAAMLGGVSCLSAGLCLAVGATGSSASQAFVEQWNGSSWSATVLPAASGAEDLLPYAVSCTTPQNCMAVGKIGSPSVPWSLFWNGTTWTAPSTPSATDAGLDSVSCVGTAFCVAVGASSPGGGGADFENVMETWNGSAWTMVPLGSPPQFADFLNGVSCFSATSCTAVGGTWTSAAPNISTQVLNWNGQSWNAATGSNVQGAFQTSFQGVDCLADWACVAVGAVDQTSGAPLSAYNAMAPISRTGYRFVASDGGVFNYGTGAPFLGSMGGTALNAPVVGMAVMPGGDGYYLVAADGGVFSFGSAQFYGSAGNIRLNKPIVGMAVTADGGGYWLVASDGGIFSYGDAQFYGSTGNLTLNQPIVGMAPTPDGLGYYLVASDGGIFTYGNATFSGSMGGTPLNEPVVGMSVPEAGGYYLVASDGEIFSFPTGPTGPPIFGSTGAIKLNKPIVGMAAVAGGYYLSGSDGGVFAFPTGSGGLPFYGSTGDIVLNGPIVGIAG